MVIELGQRLSEVLTDLIFVVSWVVAIYITYKFIYNLVKEDD